MSSSVVTEQSPVRPQRLPLHEDEHSEVAFADAEHDAVRPFGFVGIVAAVAVDAAAVDVVVAVVAVAGVEVESVPRDFPAATA